MTMNIANAHRQTKTHAYWDDLVGGTTSQYKERIAEALIRKHLKIPCHKLLDVGCGTGETILKYADMFPSSTLTFLDYDVKVMERMKQKLTGKNIRWEVADIFHLKDWQEKFDLVFFMDMLHEIYSFYGRPKKDVQFPVEHSLGQNFVREAVSHVSRLVNHGGGIIITDNILCEEDRSIEVFLKNREAGEAVKQFLKEYTTKKIPAQFESEDILKIHSRDFCILLTQYNKIKRKDLSRWNTERFEIHQYMTLKEYKAMFDALKFSMHAVVGTPASTQKEWEGDYKILKGLSHIPEKRVTLLAIKE